MSLGATLVAVTPQLESFNRRLAEEKGLSFPILSDPGNRVAAAFNLVYQLPEDLRKVYLGFGIDLVKFNGDDLWTLPMPARFVIDRGGILRAAEVSADYTVRPDPAETVEVLKNLAERSQR